MINVLVILFALVLARDIFPELVLRLKRLRRLQHVKPSVYADLLKIRSLKMLASRLPMRANDHRCLRVIDDIKFLLRGDPFYFSWPSAWVVKGLLLQHEGDEDVEIVPALEQFYDRFIDASGQLKFDLCKLDQVAHGELLLRLAELTGKNYTPAINQMYDYVISTVRGDLMRYRNNVNVLFVDTLGLACPFLARLGRTHKNDEAIALALRQIRDFLNHGLEPRSGLPFHGYSATDKLPVGIVGWGRGTGWLATGLIETYAELPESGEKENMGNAVRALVRSIEKYQQPDGGWSGIVNCASPLDTSATAMFVYFFARAYELEVLDQRSVHVIEKAIGALTRATHTDGTVDFAQTDCMGIGRLSTIYEPTPFVQGMALLALTQYRKVRSHAW